MEHLDDTHLNALLFDQRPLPEAEASHLAACPACRARLENLHLLQTELEIARRSRPTPEQLARYTALFPEVAAQNLGQRIGAWLDALRLSLVADSRQSGAAMGLRRAAGFGHRLLYGNEQVDVEMLLEPEGDAWQIEGDVLPLDDSAILAPYLVELLPDPSVPATADHTGQSDERGRFRLVNVLPGRYDLLITPADGPAIEIRELTIP